MQIIVNLVLYSYHNENIKISLKQVLTELDSSNQVVNTTFLEQTYQQT